MTFAKNEISWNIVEHIMDSHYTTFERFSMKSCESRSNLVTFGLIKKITSNRCKTIGFLQKNLVYQYMLRDNSDYNIVNFQKY